MRSAAVLCSAVLVAPVLCAVTPAAASPLATDAATSTRAAEGDRRVGFHPLSTPATRGGAAATATRVLTTGVVAVPTDVAVIGVSWVEGTGDGVRLAYRAKRGGVWSAWEDVEVEPCPDCAAPGSSSRAGSEAIAVTGATHVEGRLTAGVQATRDPRLAIIDPATLGTTGPARRAAGAPASARGGVSAASLAALAPATQAKRPAKKSTNTVKAIPVPAGLPGPRASMPSKRAEWRASETSEANSVPGTAPRGVVVHHTAGTNSYSRSQVPSILRGIQRFHTQDRGWADIGYNALVDRFGGVWEGRRGGIGIAHRGAHARGVNEAYLGVSYIGDTNAQPATQEGVDAMVDLIGWTSARYGFEPSGTLTVNGASKPVVAGHYQVGNTSCPGTDLISRLGDMRSQASTARADYLAIARSNAGRG